MVLKAVIIGQRWSRSLLAINARAIRMFSLVVKIQCAQRFQPLGMWRLVMGAKVGAGCGGWRWVRGMPLDMICGVGQEGACFANSLMGRCSRLP